MNGCLCCGKPLEKGGICGWHESRVKKFFGLNAVPNISLDKNTLEFLAEKSVQQGFTVPGVQKKLSLHLEKEGKRGRLTLVDYPTGYILKPQVEEYDFLPELEWVGMKMAAYVGIATVENALMKVGGEYAYICKRIDRVFSKEGIQKLAMEDFCQLDLRTTIDKYRGSYERCAKIIQRYSSRPGLDLSELFLRVVFSYIIGNSDMHLKNLSLIETKERSGVYILSPAYDLLPVQIALPEDEEEFALMVNGKKKNVTINDFYAFGSHCGLSKAACAKMIRKLTSSEDGFLRIIEGSVLIDELKMKLIGLVKERCALLS